ncbi:hypothetical protein CAEBREN_29305 [Caenorhabditis brenneri]|uniref:Uncharacterized protein n=1 Tax=Caenorhabditis brenneri TaxID=135651 RepID=G0NJA7_CAEBE|nr:hypothetical protein CAEBREN_29305 [Caenorhabditis brenneri]
MGYQRKDKELNFFISKNEADCSEIGIVTRREKWVDGKVKCEKREVESSFFPLMTCLLEGRFGRKKNQDKDLKKKDQSVGIDSLENLNQKFGFGEWKTVKI